MEGGGIYFTTNPRDHNICLVFVSATNLCFSEKHIYTLEVLATVMNQLVEQTPLPTLLMRTVIQSIAMYPKLLGYAMNILQRLINKQVGYSVHMFNLLMKVLPWKYFQQFANVKIE